jgi:hypothetical protein
VLDPTPLLPASIAGGGRTEIGGGEAGGAPAKATLSPPTIVIHSAAPHMIFTDELPELIDEI